MGESRQTSHGPGGVTSPADSLTVDVVIPCFNAAPFIAETIESVLAQTRRPKEIIVVDDSSTDESGKIAAAFGPPVRVVRQPNGGDCASRNRGLDESSGDWVAFLDADDVWRPDKLERQLACIGSRDDVVCVHSDFYLFGGLEGRSKQELRVPPDGGYPAEDLVLEPLVNTSTAMVRRDVAGRFPEYGRQGGDMLFFAALALLPRGVFVYVPEPLAGYRMHPNQATRLGHAWVSNFQSRFRWVDEMEPRLGVERSEQLRERLREQVVEWIDLARWTRQWERYRVLKEYARSLAWKGAPPPVLQERLLPPACYAVKDWIDALVMTGRPSRSRGRT